MNVKCKDSFLKLAHASKDAINECLMQNLPINIFLVDVQGYVCWANDRLLKTANLTLQEAEGMHISQWDQVRADYIFEVLKTQQETRREEVYKGIHFSTIRRPLFDKDDKIIGVLGVSMDISDRKKAEVAKEQFLHNIRHDIRTPLSGIIGITSVLQDAVKEESLLSLLDSLAETSESLLTLLDRVFESIQLTTGETGVLNHRFPLKEVLESVYKLHRAKSVEKNLAMNFYYDPALPVVVVGEALRVQRIAWELLTNALKYTEKGFIELNARLVKKTRSNIIVEIEVKDTGIGIPPDKHEVVFGQFTRLTPAWARETFGQGLGLFNVKKLVEDLKGEVFLKSSVNKGSTFTCRLKFERAEPLMSERDAMLG